MKVGTRMLILGAVVAISAYTLAMIDTNLYNGEMTPYFLGSGAGGNILQLAGLIANCFD
jgi:hypothetical protein